VGDILYLQTFDGKTVFVPDEDIRFLVYGGFGAPDVNWITRKGYRQHGETEVDYLLDKRTISIRLWRSPACSRQQYWDNRLALHEFLRHNRNGPLTFVLREPDGAKRALTVRANPGLQFPMPDAESNNWSVDDTIDFVAFDPIWFNPDLHSSYIATIINLNLVFPITFPIQFGSASIISSSSITYQGTWVSYPTITLFGPYTSAVVENVTTGIRIYLTVAIAGTERRIITLTPGSQSIVDGNGVNHFGDLGSNSNLVDFNLRPDPETPGGVQIIQATFLGGITGTTAFQIDYQDRYFGI
jgi:hypothetical protein